MEQDPLALARRCAEAMSADDLASQRAGITVDGVAPGRATARMPVRVHSIGFGDLFQYTNDYQAGALDFLLKVQQKGNTSESTATGIESYKIITGNYNTRIANLRTALERIVQSGIQVSLIK